MWRSVATRFQSRRLCEKVVGTVEQIDLTAPVPAAARFADLSPELKVDLIHHPFFVTIIECEWRVKAGWRIVCVVGKALADPAGYEPLRTSAIAITASAASTTACAAVGATGATAANTSVGETP